jgi:hypothetical protein
LRRWAAATPRQFKLLIGIAVIPGTGWIMISQVHAKRHRGLEGKKHI